jgi:hypothetical protein
VTWPYSNQVIEFFDVHIDTLVRRGKSRFAPAPAFFYCTPQSNPIEETEHATLVLPDLRLHL